MDDKSQKRQLGEQLLNEAAERVAKKPRVGSFDTGSAISHFSGQGIQLTGHGDFNVYKGNVNITTTNAAPTTATRDCLRDLFITDPYDDRTALKRKKGNRATGTCEWILETEELTAWLGQGQTSNVLWLYGNPGTGKSTMAIFLTEQLSTVFSAIEGKTLAYFFCDSSFDKRKTATSVIRGLLLQLVQQHPKLLDYILPKYNERGKDLYQSFDALWAVFMAIATDQKTGQKYCVIDALDECDRESQKILLQQFQETFHSQDAPSNVRILVTSRPYSEICEYLDEFTNKDVASFPQAKKDIDQCIEERVADLVKKKHYTVKVKEQVSNILRDKAESTFLWVGLACEELKEIPSKDAVKVLQDMPKGLHSLYKTLLDTAQEESGTDILRRILSLVAVCMRPLSVLELSEACQLYEEEVDIETRVQFTRDQIASCRLIIIVQDEKVLLLHQSVKDYLVGTSSGYFIDELEAHANIAYRCVCLLMEEFHSGKQPKMHFISYAIRRWPDHARMAQTRFEVRDSEAEFFRINSPSRDHWLNTLSTRFSFVKNTFRMSILHIAARWNIAPLMDYVTTCDQNCQESDAKKVSFIDVDCVDEHNITPIEMAIKWGSINVISKLLCLNAEVNEHVVATAAMDWKNNEEAMALLLDHRGDQITITENIVRDAARSFNGKLMTLFLDRRGDQITITENIVRDAALNSNSEVMALLLDRRGDQITITENIVRDAARSSNSEVMALLLDRRGDQITITENIVRDAALNSNSEVMALLLDRRGDQITITENIVRDAARSSNSEVMALLLDRRGGQIIITDDVVKAAAGNRREGLEILTLLFNQRKDQILITEHVVKAAAGNRGKGEEIMTLLFNQFGNQIIITEDVVKAAVENWENGKEITALLLDRCGNHMTITESILEAAAGNYESGEEVMTLLLDRYSGQINITEDILIATAENAPSGKKVMALLLDWYGDEIDITEDIIKAALENEASGEEIMTLLLERCGDQITITEDVVKIAATCGQVEFLDSLSKQDLITSDWDKWYRISDFYNAAKAGNVDTIERLLDEGVNPNLKNASGYTLLTVAILNEYEAAVKALAQRADVDIDSSSDIGVSPLFLAATNGYERIVTILLEAGADPELKDDLGRMAVDIARENGYERIVEILEREG
ncbi:ankyrin repeats (3 copies) domain-containing protein [Trichoderma breve]|uniref:Ankyrin repeats (3 copies) domain-containing protein n=1 Tax=Trichoderma breve TaxID=2034170 RepID=A0A9W9B8H4_9HYPO|nr:ankyrin repeats (3 copies) domain-containing protein [Trichoderma breve]KAJ4855373.1 ankyrin repeats (3 copies) domain-containing protein [Trichoderma breve]